VPRNEEEKPDLPNFALGLTRHESCRAENANAVRAASPMELVHEDTKRHRHLCNNEDRFSRNCERRGDVDHGLQA
jgi:hypothetical protein